jgi:hypothetical protein
MTTMPILCRESVVLLRWVSKLSKEPSLRNLLGTHVRQQGNVVKLGQLGVDLRLIGEHIQSDGPELVALFQGLDQRFFIDDSASGGVDKDRVVLHGGELSGGE